MHAAAVVAKQGLGHEGHRLVVTLGDVLDDVLVHQQVVRHLHQVLEPQVDLRLPGGRHLVMLGLHVETAVDHGLHHFVADIHQLVGGRHREIAFLVTELVAQVRTLAGGLRVLAPVPLPLDAVEVVETAVLRLIEAHVVKDEELRLRPEVRRVGDARALQVVHGLARDIARIARVILASDRVLDVADHRDRGHRGERIDKRRFGLGHDQHVALVDRLPPADAGAVEPQTVLKNVFRQLASPES